MSNTNENNRPHELSLDDQAAVEQVLAAVTPAPPRIDRDRLMFLAGAASVSSDLRPSTFDLRPPTSAWHWPAATAALAATSLALATALFLRPAPPERIVYVPQPVELASTELASGGRQPPEAIRVAQQVKLTQSRNVASTTAPQHNYLRTRDVALRFGLDALGTPTSGSGGDASAPTYRSLLEAMSPAQPRSPSEAPKLQQM